MTPSFFIRQANESDLSAIVIMNGLSNPHPWGESLILEALKTRMNWVIESSKCPHEPSGKSVLGWLTASHFGDQSELELIVVSRDVRRQGLAKQLITEWQTYAQGNMIAELLLEVRESNAGAIALYEALDFKLVGTRKNYYQTECGREAAHLFTLTLKTD